jgi:hypothetical protein
MLTAYFLQRLEGLWNARILLFWPIWSSIAVAAIIFLVLALRKSVPLAAQKSREVQINLTQTRRSMLSVGAAAALLLLGLVVAYHIVLMFVWEDFAYYDNSQFTLVTLRGENFVPPIWRESGRFFPLYLQEFNLIRHFAHTVAGYHALPIVQLLILCYMLLRLDDELGIAARAALIGVALLTLGIVISFTGLTHPERNVIFCLAGMVISVRRFEQTQSTAWATAAALCAQIMIYYKEVAFLMLLSFAFGRLVLRCRNADRAGWDWSRLRDRNSRLDWCLGSLGILFLLYYILVMLPHPNMQYANRVRLPWVEVFAAYLKLDFLAWLFMAVVFCRIYLIIRRRVAPLLLWDGLAFGGTAYFAAYLYLGICSAYFLAPVDLIAVLYVGRFVILSWKRINGWTRLAASILLVPVILLNISLAAFRVYEVKNIIHAKSELASRLKVRFEAWTGNELRLFFPFTNPYVLMEFASYLAYRGIPVEDGTSDISRKRKVIIVSTAVSRDGPCVDFRSIICRASEQVRPGELVIVLPDDDASLADAIPYIDRGEMLLSYTPWPHIPERLDPVIEHLKIASPLFALKELPDRWLHASITVWK